MFFSRLGFVIVVYSVCREGRVFVSFGIFGDSFVVIKIVFCFKFKYFNLEIVFFYY